MNTDGDCYNSAKPPYDILLVDFLSARLFGGSNAIRRSDCTGGILMQFRLALLPDLCGAEQAASPLPLEPLLGGLCPRPGSPSLPRHHSNTTASYVCTCYNQIESSVTPFFKGKY